MKSLRILLIGAFFVINSALAQAAPEKFSLDKENTYVGFNVSYLLLARISGRFDDFQGSFVIDNANPEKSRADIIVKTGSVNTGIKSRDKDIRGPNLFHTDLYPTMVFHSKKIAMGTDNKGIMTGKLTLLGITKPVTMNIVRIPGPKLYETGKDKSFAGGFKVTGKIKRSDFGMNTYSKPIGNIVTLYVCYGMVECGGDATNQKKFTPVYND